MEGLVALAHLAVVDIADDVLVLVGVQFLAELDFVDFLALKQLLARDASKVEHLHKIHHVVRTKHRI